MGKYPDCEDCMDTGEVFTHAEGCASDFCALNGDFYSCVGQIVPCHCSAGEVEPPADWQAHVGQDFGKTDNAVCPECGEAADWRDIEGHPDGGEYFCPMGCKVPGTAQAQSCGGYYCTERRHRDCPQKTVTDDFAFIEEERIIDRGQL